MSTSRYLISRLLQGIALVLAVVVLNFVLVHAAPGDPVETIAGASGGMSEELKAELRTQYGLDRPLPVQLAVYLGKVVRGDLGHSYFFNVPVSGLIAERVPATLLLVLASVLVAFLAGTALGVLSSRKPNGPLSQAITVLSLVGFAAPVFWTGIMLVILFASVVPLFPVSGMRDVESLSSAESLAGLVDVLHHLVLPTLTLALVYLAQYSRLARASMLDVLGSDFIRTARAKGLAEGVVLYKHALRNAVLPVTTFLGLLGARHLDTGFVRSVRHLRSRGLAAKLHLALDAAPEFTGLDAAGLGARLLVAPSMDHVERAYNHSKYGEFSEEPVIEITLPTVHDQTLAPPGRHVLSAVVQCAPHALKRGWDEPARRTFQDRIIDTIEQVAPGLRGRIIASQLLTPADIERKFRISGGHWHHGELAFDQFFMVRPVPGAAQYSTPVEGLYLCGSGSHPGGGVTGLPGRNAAHRVIEETV